MSQQDKNRTTTANSGEKKTMKPKAKKKNNAEMRFVMFRGPFVYLQKEFCHRIFCSFKYSCRIYDPKQFILGVCLFAGYDSMKDFRNKKNHFFSAFLKSKGKKTPYFKPIK